MEAFVLVTRMFRLEISTSEEEKSMFPSQISFGNLVSTITLHIVFTNVTIQLKFQLNFNYGFASTLTSARHENKQ